MSLIALTADQFSHYMDQPPALLIIDFWAPWCAPCQNFSPIFHEVAEMHPDIIFAKVNIDEEQELAQAFQVRSIPMLIIMKSGVVIYAESGILSKKALADLVEQAKSP